MKPIKPSEIDSCNIKDQVVGLINQCIKAAVLMDGGVKTGLKIICSTDILRLSHCDKYIVDEIIREFEDAGYKTECSRFYSFSVKDTYTLIIK
jgi:hypothetical protein